MKVLKLSRISVVLITALFGSTLAFAAPMFQAGDIEDGKSWTISQTSGVASYYATGKAGAVEFSCELQGEPTNCSNNELTAMVRPGKNFENIYNPIAFPLQQGTNGPYIWQLTDAGETVGNIKVFYSCGSNVTIQCKGKRIS